MIESVFPKFRNAVLFHVWACTAPCTVILLWCNGDVIVFLYLLDSFLTGQYRSTGWRRGSWDSPESHEEQQFIHPEPLPGTVSIGHHLSFLQHAFLHLWSLCLHLPPPPSAREQADLRHCRLPKFQSKEPCVWSERFHQCPYQKPEKQACRDMWHCQVSAWVQVPLDKEWGMLPHSVYGRDIFTKVYLSDAVYL